MKKNDSTKSNEGNGLNDPNFDNIEKMLTFMDQNKKMQNIMNQNKKAVEITNMMIKFDEFQKGTQTKSFHKYHTESNMKFADRPLKPASLEEEFEMDKEEYINTYFNSAFKLRSEYNELTFLKIIINKLKDAHHPDSIDYRDYLIEKQAALIGIVEPQSDTTSKVFTVEELYKKQNKLTTKISLQEVYNHFKILAEKTNKKNQYYLTPEQLLIFINSTFTELKPIKQSFSCDDFVKKDIRKIFYEFYCKFKNRERNETKIKRKYFNILDESFTGFNENDYIDFAK